MRYIVFVVIILLCTNAYSQQYKFRYTKLGSDSLKFSVELRPDNTFDIVYVEGKGHSLLLKTMFYGTYSRKGNNLILKESSGLISLKLMIRNNQLITLEGFDCMKGAGYSLKDSSLSITFDKRPNFSAEENDRNICPTNVSSRLQRRYILVPNSSDEALVSAKFRPSFYFVFDKGKYSYFWGNKLLFSSSYVVNDDQLILKNPLGNKNFKFKICSDQLIPILFFKDSYLMIVRAI